MKHYHTMMFALVLFLSCTLTAVTGGDTTAALMKKCSDDFTKVAACMGFATGKAEVPTKDCCGSVEDIKSKQPECLCFFMEQTLNGSDAVKGMGIHEDRLLRLPSACKLTNASVSFCPKLLNIPANSPLYKKFTNVSSLSPSTPPSTTSSGASFPLKDTKSSGHMFGPQISSLISIVVATFLYVSWAWGLSLSYFSFIFS